MTTTTATTIETAELAAFRAILTDAERITFDAARDRAWRNYMKRNGAPTIENTPVRTEDAGEHATGEHYRRLLRTDAERDAIRAELAEHADAWRAEHLEPARAAVAKAAVAAVKREHTKRTKAPAEYVASRQVATDAAWLAELERQAAESADRLRVLGLDKPARKPAARKSTTPAPVAEPIAEPAKPAEREVTAVTVPAPMPRMTRAARKASNRELAARMRRAGIAITTESWAAAKAGTLAGLENAA